MTLVDALTFIAVIFIYVAGWAHGYYYGKDGR